MSQAKKDEGFKIAFKDPNPGIKFFLSKNESEWIRARSLNDDMAKEIEKEVTTIDEGVMGGRFGEVRTVDEKRKAELTFDYCIMGWSGIVGDDEKPIECTKETKIHLMRRNPNFALLIKEMIAVAGSREALRMENDLKNFFRS